VPPPAPQVAVGDALFIDNGLPVGAGFLRTLAAQYGAGARTVDFMSRGALEQINAWVRDQTAGRITRIFEALDPSTQLVLANTVYFKAYWKSMFERPMTQAARFTRGDGSPVTADMMTSVVSARYARVGGFQAVELPYFGGSYAMWLAIPPAGRRPLDAVEPATVAAVTGAMGTERLTVSLPRFDFAAGLDLAETLPALGLTIPFGASADFSGIAPGLFISQAAHRANIAVTEDGTEAAAATGIAMATSGQMPPPLFFVADRPFAFMIVGGADRVPLFVGQVADPTAK
jgi:serpin B